MTSKSRSKVDPDLEDRIDCINQNIANFRPDIRQIIHEEMTNVVNEALSKLLKEMRKPKPYVGRGYRA